jgi:hypothetical protein
MFSKLWAAFRKIYGQIVASIIFGVFGSLSLYFTFFIERQKEVKLILFAGLFLVIGFSSYLILFRFFPVYFQRFEKHRIVMMAVLTVAASAAISYMFVTVGSSLIQTRHNFELIPIGQKSDQSSGINVILFEIRDENGEIVPFEKLDPNDSWEKSDHDGLNALIASNTQSESLLYPFYGNENDAIQVLFKSTDASGKVVLRLDTDEQLVDLFDEVEGDTILILQVDYNIQQKVGLFTIYFFGFLFLFLCLWGLWVIIELNTQNRLSSSAQIILNYVRRTRDRPIWLLGILLTLSLTLHTISILSTPLKVYPDSGGYINAAISITKYRDWGSILAAFRGPGWALMFSPILAVFGENPWPIKIFLHLLGIGQVLLAFGVGKIITQKNWVAFICGLLVLLSPDITASSNIILSESVVPFFVFLFVFTALKYLQTGRIYMIYFCFLVVLATWSLRTENLVLGFVFLTATGIQLGLKKLSNREIEIKRTALHLIIALSMVILPMVYWYSFLEKPMSKLVSTFRAAVVYSGWVQFGERTGMSFLDHSSPAVQVIKDAHEQSIGFYLGKPQPNIGETWNDYRNMISIGMTDDEVADIFYQATIDSIRADPGKALELIFVKFKYTFRFTSQAGYWDTDSLPGEDPPPDLHRFRRYFSVELVHFPKIIKLQRSLNDFFNDKLRIYTYWYWFCLIGTVIFLFRKPYYQGVLLGGVIFLQIVWPPIIGFGEPRFLLRGLGVFMITGAMALYFIATSLYKLYVTNFRQA